MKELFSFAGRIGRKTYWLTTLAIVAALLVVQVLAVVMASLSETMGMIGAILALVVCLTLLVPSFAVAAKRWHDLGKSGWWTLLMFVPIANLYALVMVGFIKGEDGANDYGPDPLQALSLSPSHAYPAR